MKQSEAKTTADATSQIYLDIETSSGQPPDPTTIKAPANYTKPEAIEKYQLANADKEWRKQSLDPFKGEVFCIGIAVNDEPASCLWAGGEELTMKLLDAFLEHHPMAHFYAHNGIEFDYYWLFIKGLKYKLRSVVRQFSNKYVLKDTMKAMDGAAWKKMTSLDKMASTLGFEGKGDITGGMVHDMILEGRGDEVVEYCKGDVEILRNCAKELAKYGLI